MRPPACQCLLRFIAIVCHHAGVPKLDDANEAGGKGSDKCTLILTEGDSAKALAISGLGVVGRDHYGVFPLRGKLLNVRDASATQVRPWPRGPGAAWIRSLQAAGGRRQAVVRAGEQ